MRSTTTPSTRKIQLKSLCRDSLKKGIEVFEISDEYSSFQRKAKGQQTLISEWKKRNKATKKHIDLEVFKREKEDNEKRQMERRNFFLTFDCQESFPSWLFFLPEMKQIYGEGDDIKAIILNGKDLDEKIKYVYDKDQGRTFEIVFYSIVKKTPKKYLENEISREQCQMFNFYQTKLNNFEQAKLFMKSVETYFKNPSSDFPIFSETDGLSNVFHQTKVKKILRMKNALKDYDDVVQRKKFQAQKEWFGFMCRHEKRLQKMAASNLKKKGQK